MRGQLKLLKPKQENEELSIPVATSTSTPTTTDNDADHKKNLLDATVHRLVNTNAISLSNSSRDNLEALNILLDALGSKK